MEKFVEAYRAKKWLESKSLLGGRIRLQIEILNCNSEKIDERFKRSTKQQLIGCSKVKQVSSQISFKEYSEKQINQDEKLKMYYRRYKNQ